MSGRSGVEERRLVTSLFIDVVGSTELTMKLGPERLKAALDQAFAELRAVIVGEGGTVEKYIGDAIYALFGAPVAHVDDPERALRAAAAARSWASSREAGEIPFGVRVGLETGEAIVDLAAAADTKQQMSVGTVVNTAARLQQRAEPGQVLVGAVAHDATAEIATFTALGSVDLKGLGTIAIWQLDEVRETGARRRLPFVGRAAELELLGLAQRRARTRSVLALVSGPPGQGKTRLLEEFVGAWPGVRLLTARCRPGGEVGALAPLRQLLLGDRPATALDDIVAEAAPSAERGRLADALAHSAGIRSSPSLSGIGKDERADEIQNAWRTLLRGLAVGGPVALWVEDVHWAAPEVVALIDRLSLSGEPVLVMATARPEFAEQAGIRPSGDRFFIELDTLEPDAARALAASAGRDDAGTIERASGNPLFIVELARARDPAGDLPLTLQGALGARLDELDAADRALLARGAVLGETFTVQDLAMLSDRDQPAVARALARLAERQYLHAVDLTRGRYRFHHSLLRDVAYGRLLVADRMRLHARYAHEAHLEDPEVLAYHWWAAVGGAEAEWVWKDAPERAAMRRDAFAAHLAAARRQAALFSTDRAATELERAYVLADDDAARGQAKTALGDAYANDLRGDESWRAYLDARERYSAAGVAVPPAVYLGALKVRLRYGAFREQPSRDVVQALAREARAAAERAGDPGTAALTMLYSAFRDMDPSTSVGDPTLIAEAVRVSERADAETRREILGWYADELVRQDELDKAAAVLDEIEAMPGEVPEIDRMERLRARAVMALRRGSISDFAAVSGSLITMSRRMGPHLRTHADVMASQLAFARGDWPEVIALASSTDRLMQAEATTPFCGSAGTILANGAVAHSLAGRHEEARSLARRLSTISAAEYSSVMRAFAVALAGAAPEVPDASGGANPPPMTFDAATAVMTRQHERALAIAAALERRALGGARFWAALAQAVREEVARDRGGPPPTHALLKEIGYTGWSEVLSARAPG